MQLSKGVEWAVHSCTMMAVLPEGRGLSADALAQFFDVPSAYLAKQLQALRRADIVQSVRGQGGGYRLARGVDAISLWDIVAAIEGSAPAFRCTEIRQNGPCGLAKKDCKRPCEINSAFQEAEAAWRDVLKSRSLADINAEVAGNADPQHLLDLAQWTLSNA
ncbi:MAG: Rrf2 family transcriptional regulator [Marinomonas sp.]